ncbi:uncharacterized protein SCHCODRAFT_02614111 [Schizophyllum commune H4-8]|uniref:uncharacterized protein n=1 Tax=Schizophyllum commune (strain H4-8 / FGSC 9210) TaxID=578458 RepID=UPI002160841E|nr:uncharacterized protein SCHCODRAFT_02614111 [Schizophyllum commune H4-8]KAI5896132.1 hypothetical protein SCHCODRAFT_02614111 [Schizophyllum commune H4-8]
MFEREACGRARLSMRLHRIPVRLLCLAGLVDQLARSAPQSSSFAGRLISVIQNVPRMLAITASNSPATGKAPSKSPPRIGAQWRFVTPTSKGLSRVRVRLALDDAMQLKPPHDLTKAKKDIGRVR